MIYLCVLGWCTVHTHKHTFFLRPGIECVSRDSPVHSVRFSILVYVLLFEGNIAMGQKTERCYARFANSVPPFGEGWWWWWCACRAVLDTATSTARFDAHLPKHSNSGTHCTAWTLCGGNNFTFSLPIFFFDIYIVDIFMIFCFFIIAYFCFVKN